MKKYFTFLSLFYLLLSSASGQTTSEIPINQTGFYPEGEKLAAVLTSQPKTFIVRSLLDDSEILVGTLTAPQSWDKSGETVAIADFSELTTPGVYYLEVEDIGRSHPFFIGERANLGTARSALKAYYFNRASTELPEEYAHKWARPAGHPDTEVVVHPSAATDERPAGTLISAPKGWYDAGDFNKYIVNSGISTYTLLTAYQAFPEFFNELETNIPESGNTTPDILDESRWNLEWMLDMQDPADGGVYHKLTTANFAGAVMPHQASATRYVVQKSTAAALNFAAVMAQTYRVYQDLDPEFAQTALTAAKNAFAWALENPAIYYNQGSMNTQFDPDIHTGEYGDNNVTDEFNWAATELYLSTKDDTYYNQIRLDYDGWFGVPGWNSVNTLALMSLALHQEELTATGMNDAEEIQSAFLRTANNLLEAKQELPYRASINEFYWGSNSVAANQGMILLAAYKITQGPTYLTAANAALDYLLGRNATTYSFVTGIGKKPPMEIHHRQSEADEVEEPVPGFLAGGPNPGQQDGCKYPSSLPAKSYTDSWCSYASNEVTINWNAPLVFLAGGLEYFYGQDNFAEVNQSPVAPEALRANEFGTTEIELNWKVLSSDVMGYIIERSEGDDQNFQEIAEPSGTILSFTDNGLKENTTYFYRVKSWNTFGQSGYSEIASATTASPTGLFNTISGNRFKAFPNPSFGELQLQIHPSDVGLPLKVKIISFHGKTVEEFSIIASGQQFSVETPRLKGLYLLQLEGNSGMYQPEKVLFQ